MQDINFENRYWLQILGDHLRFIEMALAPKEKELIERTVSLKKITDQLLDEARQSKKYKKDKIEKIIPVVQSIKELKADILERSLLGKVDVCLPSTFFNHMLAELEDYENILLQVQSTGGFQEKHILDLHKLWACDAAGHAISIVQNLDPVEKDVIKKVMKINKSFEGLFNKDLEFIGYSVRTGLDYFPAIDKLNKQVKEQLFIFTDILKTLREERLSSQVLGVLHPLMADHMLRESHYYLRKVQEAAGEKVTAPDPTVPRITKPE